MGSPGGNHAEEYSKIGAISLSRDPGPPTLNVSCLLEVCAPIYTGLHYSLLSTVLFNDDGSAAA